MSEQLVSVLQDLLASARRISDNIERVTNQLAPTIDSSIQLGLVPDSDDRSEFHYIYVGGMNIDYPAYTLDWEANPNKPPRQKTETDTFVGIFEKFLVKPEDGKLFAQFKADKPTRIRGKLDGHFSIRLLASMLLMNSSQAHCPVKIRWTMGTETSAVFCSVKVYVNGAWEELRYDNNVLDRIQRNPIGAANKVHQNLGLPPVEELTNDRNTEDEQQNARSGARSSEPPPRQSQPKAQPQQYDFAPNMRQSQPVPDEQIKFPQNPISQPPTPQPVTSANNYNEVMGWVIKQIRVLGYSVQADEVTEFCRKKGKEKPSELTEPQFFELLKYYCCRYWASYFLGMSIIEAEQSFAAVSAAIDEQGLLIDQALLNWMNQSIRRSAELVAAGEEF